MPIDFTPQTDEWWKASFERYITGGNDFETIRSGGLPSIQRHYHTCLPEADFGDKNLEQTNTEWIITATHPRGGKFTLRANRWSSGWSFGWGD